MLNFEFIENNTLPYRVVIDNLYGAAQTKSDAIMVALSAGKMFPPELRKDKKAVANYLFWNYRVNPNWAKLISILLESISCRKSYCSYKKLNGKCKLKLIYKNKGCESY